MERLFVLKTLSRTQRATKVKIFVGFSLKPLRCRDPALPPSCGRAYSRAFFLLKARMRIIVFTAWWTEAVLYGGAEKCQCFVGMFREDTYNFCRGFCTLVLFIIASTTLGDSPLYVGGFQSTLEALRFIHATYR